MTRKMMSSPETAACGRGLAISEVGGFATCPGRNGRPSSRIDEVADPRSALRASPLVGQ